MVTFHFNVPPPESTHQAALRILKNKSGKMFVGKMKKSKTVNWKNTFRSALAYQRPKTPLFAGQPLRLIVGLFYKPPASRPCPELEWKVTKPDADNVVKVILDSLVDCGYIEADQKIADLRVMKLEWDHGNFMEIMVDQCGDFCSPDFKK
jgi:Holliday junction resolvase RusA-like endonuclease